MDKLAALRGLALISGILAVAAGAAGCEKEAPPSSETPAPAKPVPAEAGNEKPAGSETPAAPAAEEPAAGMKGGISVKATGSVDEAVARLEAAIKAKGLTLFSTIDHAGNAKKAGLELRPTTLVIFGNPKIGTRLMTARQTVALNLPMKMLIYQAEDGGVHVMYEDPKSLAERHGLAGVDDVLGKVSGALAGLAKAAAGQ